MRAAEDFAMAIVREVGFLHGHDGLGALPMVCLATEGLCMAYEWDPRRAQRARIIRYVTALAISASVITVPVAVLLAAAPN